MKTPWIEQIPSEPWTPAGSSQADSCQALFAGQVDVLPYNNWSDLKWGFNGSALMDEALDRQKLFIESQHNFDLAKQVEPSANRSLSLRLICLPEQGLQVGLLGRVCGATPQQAEKDALIYWRELSSVVPYDYRLTPASNRADFRRLAGCDLLEGYCGEPALAEIKRAEAFLPTSRGFQILPGFWQSGAHANEQVWRALAAMPNICLLDIIIQPALLYENEQQILWEIKHEITNGGKDKIIFPPLAAYGSWGEACINRRLAPWKKYFYMQVQLVMAGGYDESLLRSIATAITRESADIPQPGYQVLRPASTDEALTWCQQLTRLQFRQPQKRIELLADLEETWAVFRLPHQVPPVGLPGVNFISHIEEQN